jgi:hypothetical protein
MQMGKANNRQPVESGLNSENSEEEIQSEKAGGGGLFGILGGIGGSGPSRHKSTHTSPVEYPDPMEVVDSVQVTISIVFHALLCSNYTCSPRNENESVTTIKQ